LSAPTVFQAHLDVNALRVTRRYNVYTWLTP